MNIMYKVLLPILCYSAKKQIKTDKWKVNRNSWWKVLINIFMLLLWDVVIYTDHTSFHHSFQTQNWVTGNIFRWYQDISRLLEKFSAVFKACRQRPIQFILLTAIPKPQSSFHAFPGIISEGFCLVGCGSVLWKLLGWKPNSLWTTDW